MPDKNKDFEKINKALISVVFEILEDLLLDDPKDLPDMIYVVSSNEFR